MGMLKDLERGRGGVRLAIPGRFTIDDEGPDFAAVHDAERGIGWHLSRHGYHIDLSSEHQALLVRDIERHARALFETYSSQLSSAPSAPALRTEDPAWSPVVSVDRARIGGHDALTVIHRMSYQPGNEVLMGHLLVPIRSGLFELRVLAPARMTGTRESALLAAAMNAAPDQAPDIVMSRLGQEHYDDPRHDSLFPDHPLSRVRAELRALLEGDGGLAVTAPDDPPPRGEAPLPALGCAITPPPRYARVRARTPLAQWSRLSFAGTDGVQLLSVARESNVRFTERDARRQLAQMAEEYARASVPEGATEVSVEARPLPDREGRARVIAYLRYDPEDGSAPRHTALHWHVDQRGHPFMIAIAAERCVPEEELIADVDAVAASWRPLDDEEKKGSSEESPARKPWWKLW